MTGHDAPPGPSSAPTESSRLLPPREVRRLLGIGRTTLHDWTVQGRLETVPWGLRYRKYPADQPLLAERLAAAEDAR